MKNKFIFFYFIMAMIVSYIPVYWSASENSPEQILFAFGFVSGILLFSFSAASMLLTAKAKSKTVMFGIKIISTIFLCLPGIMYMIYMIPYITIKKALTEDDVLAFFQTYEQEAVAYLSSNVKFTQTLWTGSILLLFVISLLMFVIKFQNFSGKSKKIMSAIGIILSCAFIHNALTSPIESGIRELHEYEALAEQSKQMKEVVVKQSAPSKGIFVVVIGESQNRNHMQVYGYNRPTTPFLAAERNNHSKGEWIYFNNPYSCHTHTFRVLKWAMTDINSYNKKELSKAKLILDVLNENGYQTWWISNQKKTEHFEALLSHAQHQLWLNDSNEKDPYDEVVLSALPSEADLKKQSTVIFIHLMGNHLHYRDRYPEIWSKFGYHKAINQYDNSILYNDYIISRIYNHFANMKNFAAMIYMSDHAEDVKGIVGHNVNLFNWSMTKIPFFAFFGKDYIKHNREKIKILETRKNTPFVNEMFFDFLLGILNIKDENYVSQNDFSNAQYLVRDDFATIHGTKEIADEKNDEVLEYRSKIWLHKVNSPAKLEKAEAKYFGVEMDIIYHEEYNAFENSHNKTDLLTHHLGRTLEKYHRPLNLWFDFKNLTADNKENARSALETLVGQYGIWKSEVWLESPKWTELENFTQTGWRTSYYLQIHDFNTLSQEKIEKIRSKIKDISYSGKVSAISFTHEYYPLVMSADINPEISLLTWFGGKTLNELKDNDEFLSILRNPQIKVVLVEE